MKYLFILLCLCSLAEALPTANPYDPTYMKRSKLSFFEGFYGDYVFNRNLETVNDQSIQKMKMNTNALALAIKGWKRFELTGIVGSSQLNMITPSSSFLVSSHMLQINALDSICWGVGLNSYLFDYGGFGFGLSAFYFSNPSSVRDVIDLDNGITFYPENAATHYIEKQIGLSLTRKIALCESVLLLPYVSAKYSDVVMNFNGLSSQLSTGETLIVSNLHAARRYGYAVGLSLLGYERSNLTFEGRFYDEKALHLNFTFSF